MEELVWSDQAGPRLRDAWLLVITPAGRVMRFVGQSIPGVVAVRGYDYRKRGPKWSHTIYRLALADGVRAIAGHDGFETGRFIEGLADATHRPTCDTWADVANALGVTLEEAQRFLREWRPKAAASLDTVESELAALDDAEEGGADVITFTFGNPTRRRMAAGFWGWPVRVLGDWSKEIGRIVPDPQRGWSSPAVVGERVRLLSISELSGQHGGHISLRLAVPAGARVEHGEAE